MKDSSMPKAYNKDGQYLYTVYGDKKAKRIIAEVEGGYLTIFHEYFDSALGSSVEFVSSNEVGERKEEGVTKL